VRLDIRAGRWRSDGIDACDIDASAGNAAIFLFIGGARLFLVPRTVVEPLANKKSFFVARI
jgi:hypothetical protein